MELGEETYVAFMERTRSLLKERALLEDFTKLSGEEWEVVVFNQALELCEKEKLDWKIINTKAAEFPDIVINDSFGVEVKATKDDHWITPGNSINESRRVQTVEVVYFFYGKFGGRFDIRMKPYEKCLKNIVTTHYPRYLVDMDLPEGESIFDKLAITYDEYRYLSGEERIRFLKDFMRKNFKDGEALWWIDDTTPPVINNFNRMDQATKKSFTILVMVRCPEIFKGSRERGKYDRVAQILLTEYRAVSGNLRDHFSASGQVSITLRSGLTIQVPQVIYQLHSSAQMISTVLENLPEADLPFVSKNDGQRLDEYANLLNAEGDFWHEDIGAGDVFLDGLGRS